MANGLSIEVLGSGGWIPTDSRATCCVLVRDGAEALLLDAGTGVSNLVRSDGRLHGVERLHIVLSHFHLDHVVGLSYLPALPDQIGVSIYAPGLALTGRDSRALLSTLVGDPYLSEEIGDMVESLFEFGDGRIDAGPFTLQTHRNQAHHGGSYAFRLGDDLVYCTDTEPEDSMVGFARGVRTMMHEAWMPMVDGNGHSSARSAGIVAAEAEVRQLVLVHIHPLSVETGSLRSAAAAHFGNVIVGEDELQIR